MAGSASPTSTGPRRCCRTPARSCRRVSRRPGRQRPHLPDRLSARRRTVAIGGTATANARLFAGAKEAGVVGVVPVRRPRRLQQGARPQPFRSVDRLGLVLLHHQADVPGARLLLPLRRQFRHRRSCCVTVMVKLLFFPLANKSYASMAKMKSVQPQLQALKERFPDDTAEAAAGDDGDLPQGEDQPDRRLSSRG